MGDAAGGLPAKAGVWEAALDGINARHRKKHRAGSPGYATMPRTTLAKCA